MSDSSWSREMGHESIKVCNAVYHRVFEELIREETERQGFEDELTRDGLFEPSPPMSISRRLLIRAACEMWSGGRDREGGRPTNLEGVLSVVDEDNLRRLVRALEIDAGLRTDETGETGC